MSAELDEKSITPKSSFIFHPLQTLLHGNQYDSFQDKNQYGQSRGGTEVKELTRVIGFIL